MVFLSAVLIAVVIVWATMAIAREIRLSRERTVEERAAAVLATFAPGVAAAQDDPRALLTWQPLAAAARRLDAEAFVLLDKAAGGTFPFTTEQMQSAHARWTTDWLAWERAHDGESKLKAAEAEAALAASGGATVARARVDAVEREKLEQYQRRYAEYVRISKALQALTG